MLSSVTEGGWKQRLKGDVEGRLKAVGETTLSHPPHPRPALPMPTHLTHFFFNEGGEGGFYDDIIQRPLTSTIGLFEAKRTAL